MTTDLSSLPNQQFAPDPSPFPIEGASWQQTDTLPQLIQTILHTSLDGIAIVGPDARFLEVNPAFGHLFAVDPQQAIGLQCMELLGYHENSSHNFHQDLSLIHNALEQQQLLPYTEVDLLIRGTLRSIGFSVTPISTNTHPLCLLIARDVTTLREATTAKTKFLSMVTHELRSPLNAMLGYLDLLLTGVGGELNAQQREFAQRARAGSEHLYALLEDLLLISRADTGQLRLNRQEADIQEIITDALEELEATAVDNQVTVTVDFADELPLLHIDPVRIQQVLRNLISNALRFTSPGGAMSIRAHLVDDLQDTDRRDPIYRVPRGGAEKPGRLLGTTPTTLSTTSNTEWVEVQIRDTGCGIALEYQQRIFERFYQAPRATTGRAGGQGLGLAVVKLIVELHGGQVVVESVPDQGSTFSFRLPCKEKENQPF